MRTADTLATVLLFASLLGAGALMGGAIVVMVQAWRPKPPGPPKLTRPWYTEQHPQAAGIFGALADCGLPAGSIMAYMRCARRELDGLTPRQAVIAGRGTEVLELARSDADELREAEQQTQVLPRRFETRQDDHGCTREVFPEGPEPQPIRPDPTEIGT